MVFQDPPAGISLAGTMTVPECNDLFQRCITGYPDEYFAVDHEIAPEVLERVSAWIDGILQG